MKALTIWQPWASLIVGGCKLYEFRRHRAPRSIVGQRFVIHAGKHVVGHEDWVALTTDINHLRGSTGLDDVDQLAAARQFLAEGWANGLPLGAALGTAVLGEPRRCLDIFASTIDPDEIDPDMWGWPVGHVEQWPQPVPAQGAQGFWDWDAAEVPDAGHRCHAKGCDAPTPPTMLMCRRHWRMVPRAVQREVWRHYRPGQEQDKRPTDAYLIAARGAIAAVADREQRLV